jgi:hypothetical protein
LTAKGGGKTGKGAKQNVGKKKWERAKREAAKEERAQKSLRERESVGGGEEV